MLRSGQSAVDALRSNWPEYLIEAWGLGTFMLSAALFSTLFEYPGSRIRHALPDADLRRALVGVAMGITAIGIIYSPWGKRSGAHLNPSITLTFLVLGKVGRWDALFFVVAQFIGGLSAVVCARWLLGVAFTAEPVSYAATMPGAAGVAVAFIAGLGISFGLMLVILLMSNSTRAAPYTGLMAGALVATYIALEAPLSGMSMNPARTFASAAPAFTWMHLWIYFSAPVIGMLAAAALYRWRCGSAHCAKLFHSVQVRCIHCGYQPNRAEADHDVITL